MLEAFIEFEERCTFVLRGLVTSQRHCCRGWDGNVWVIYCWATSFLIQQRERSNGVSRAEYNTCSFIREYGHRVFTGPTNEAGRGPVSKRRGDEQALT